MRELIETQLIRDLIESRKQDAHRRRDDAQRVKKLGPIYTAWAHADDIWIALLEDLLEQNALAVPPTFEPHQGRGGGE